MQPFEAEINDVVGSIWSLMLGLDVRPDRGAVDALAGRRDAVVSRVAIGGAWRGSVAIHCEAALARDLAAAMFRTPPQATTTAMVADALGELANMAGGGFKSLLAEPCRLSLPEAGGPPAPARADADAGRFGFRCGTGAFLVAVAADEPGRAAE